MEKKRPDDIRFLLNTLAITLTVVALLVAFQPYMVEDSRLEEVKRLEASLITVDPKDLPTMVKSTTGKPVMFVAYASWCYYCRQVMPIIANAMRNHELDDFTPVFVSLDDQPRKMSRYLVHKDFAPLFRPYVLDAGLFKRLSNTMEVTGSSFNGIIPYVAFYGKDGKLVDEMNRVFTRDEFISMATRARSLTH